MARRCVIVGLSEEVGHGTAKYERKQVGRQNEPVI
jgi:hypothetical protein